GRPGHLRRAGRRAPPLEPLRPRTVAAHIGRRPGRRRSDCRPQGRRVRARRPGRGPPAGGMNMVAQDIAARLPRLRERLAGAGCEAVLVSRLVNIRYLTGFTGSAAMLLVLADDLVLTTDGRYGQQSAEQLGAAGVEAR